MSEQQVRNTYEPSKPLHDLEGWIIFYGQQAQRLENDPAMGEVFQASCETAELLLELKTLRAASTPGAAGTAGLPFDEKDALLTLLRERPMKATEIHRRMFGPYSESKLNEQVVMMLLGGELLLSADRHLSIAPPSGEQDRPRVPGEL